MAKYGDSKEAESNETKHNSLPQPPHVEKLTAEDLAPDGGWGWMVAVGMTLVYIVCLAQGTTFGLVYGEFLIQTGYGGAALTTLNLMMMISLSFAGLICNEMLKRYNIKFVGILGSTIFAIANTTKCLAPNLPFLAMMFLIEGFGTGITVTVCNISFNAYFVKRRARVFGASQAVVGLVLIPYPLVVAYLLTNYGFRGCMALLGALSFNGILCMALMDPVEMHYKKPNMILGTDTVNEYRKMDFENSKDNRISSIRRHSTDAAKSWEKSKSALSLSAETEHETPLLFAALKASHRSQDRTGPGIDVETGFRSRPGKGLSTDCLSSRLSMTTALSVSSVTGVAAFGKVAEVEEKLVEGKKKTILSILGDFFEVGLLRDRIFLNICIGMSSAFLADLMFNGFLPLVMEDIGYTKEDVALTLTVNAVAELGGKILFTLFAMCFDVKARYIFLAAVYGLTICRIAFLYCNSLMSTMVVVALSGLARTWFMLPQVLVLVEYFKIEKFAAASGLCAVINGANSILMLPLVGFIRDWTQSYVVTQYALIVGLLICIVPWTIELLVCDVFSREKAREKASGK